jgi:hypothetical protein
MNKLIPYILTMLIVSVTGNSVMADSNKTCSKSRLMMKAQKNQQQAQQQSMFCRQGRQDMCEKAREDAKDAQKYQMKARNCPFP